MDQKDSLVAGKLQSRCFLWSSFTDPSLEKLYQSYSLKQKRVGLECFLISAILFDIYMLVVPSGQDFLIFGVMGLFLALNCCLLIWCKRGVQKSAIWAAIPHISWHIANAQILASLFLKKNEVTSRDNLGWILLLNYLIYVTLPIRLRYCVMCCVGTCASYLASIIGLSKFESHLIQQIDASTNNYITYKDLLQKSVRLAYSLKKCGYKENDIFAISSENNINYYTPVFASLFVGAIVAPLNPTYSHGELLHALGISTPKIVFCSNICAKKIMQAREDRDFIERIIVIDNKTSGVSNEIEPLNAFIERHSDSYFDPRLFQPTTVDINEQLAFIMCSSGTTGLPKGVMITHKNVNVIFAQLKDPRIKKASQTNTFLCIMPFFHAYGFIISLGYMIEGHSIITMPTFDERLFLKSIQDYKIETLYLVPPIIILLAKSRTVDDYNLDSLTDVLCGAAPLSKQTEEACLKRLKNVKTIRQIYGMTESISATIIPTGDCRPGSSGKVVSFLSIKICDPETCKSLRSGKVGEICLKGETIMKGYYKNEEATQNIIDKGGWLHTGDLGYFDEDEYLFVVDRLKELIKYKGYQVAPAELEALLLKNTKIKDVGVVGLPDEEAGELPFAFVVKAPEISLTEREVQDFVARKQKEGNPEWYSDKIDGLVKKKKNAYNNWLNTGRGEDGRTYARWNKEVNKGITKSKNEMWERKWEEVDRYIGETKVAEAWKTITSLRKKDRKEFGITNINIETATKQEEGEITAEEIKKALKKSKNGKALGPGSIPIELVKYGPDILLKNLANLFNKCLLNGGNIPEDWNIAYISSIHKKGNKKHVTNALLLLTANALGLTSYFVEEKQQRRAFLETRQSLEVKLVIEEQSAEQERLLLSVLPEHVAVQMRQDLDRADSQFKKIYMSRHENVSILYADIVGFTAISSTYSAQELVKMLNELFARFDKLAEKYHQLRIKILGDCYYCISGAPRERPDHAVLCVHMGLSMVKAIKYVQQTANSPVDMRVGIHTGAVLAGVLGQRQWQFDVYSKDVELANKMESAGMAGKVHISATTLSFLDGEFEIEPAYGEKKDESLRIAGLKTYFIVRVLKPYQTFVKQEVQNGGGLKPEEDSCVIADMPSDIKDEDTPDGHFRSRQNSEDFKKRLRKELVNRDGHKELAKSTKFISLAFINPDMEKAYNQHTELFSSVTLQAFLIVRLAIGISQFAVLPRRLLNFLTFLIGNAILMVISVISLAELLTKSLGKSLVSCCLSINKSKWMRRILATFCVLVLASVNIIDTISCAPLQQAHNCTLTEDTNATCLYPSYFSYFAVLVLIAASLPATLPYLCKTFLMILLTCAHCAANILILGNALDCEESKKHWSNLTKGKYTLSALLLTATLVLSLLTRHMEQVARVLFLWRSEVEEQRECASDMRRRNEALVYNILPPHVAAHFMGNRKRQHDELYSQSYAEVGVLFASMPNFSDFYSEETVNNQGLECLRFLNEVISDFDALLELPQFQDIIKIKTIGSTYMAASGLNPSRYVKPEDPVTVRWAHLALLVEFALELKKALQSINEQSFNHFVLKLGINHGPITAGVIGARKPHYDIWGNTVNVASRMESTGKAGCIQVTEETCQILQHFGYQFEQRGLVAVKGKGQLMTYYLLGKAGKITPPTAPVSPIMGGSLAMETVTEEDESHDSPTSKSDDKTVIECTDQKSDDEMFNGDIDGATSIQPLISDDVYTRDNCENTLLLSKCDA